MASLQSWTEQIVTLPRRDGPPPATRVCLPHRQLDQWPPGVIFEQLLDFGLSLCYVRSRESRMAAEGAHALYLPDEHARGPREAFIDANEFCHLGPLPHGTVHLTLPAAIRRQVEELGWGEPHPIARLGIMDSLMTIYSPRNYLELQVASHILESSYWFGRAARSQTALAWGSH